MERVGMVRTRQNRNRYTQMAQNPMRTGLSGYYGERAIAEMRAGRNRNARRLIEVSAHHALQMFGRRFGKRLTLDSIAFCKHEELGELL